MNVPDYEFGDMSRTLKGTSMSDKTTPMNQSTEHIREQYKWRTVQTPIAWRPSEEEIGTELVGFYGGKSLRDGPHGQYEVILVHVPMDRSYMVSGTRVVQLMDASLAPVGHPVRIVWKGYKETGRGHQMKLFEVLVAEGQAVPAEALPEIEGHIIQ